MTWIALAILAVLLFLAFSAWLLPTHIALMERRISEVGNTLHNDLQAIEQRLGAIESHTQRQAQELYKRDDLERTESEKNPYYHVQRDGL